VNSIVSWPVARATAMARLRSAGPWLLGVIFTITGAVRAELHGGGAETFTGPSAIWFVFLTFGLGTAILSEEIESGHAQLVLLRPLTRAAWFGGRLAGACVALAIFCVIAWLATLAAALARGYGFDAMRLPALVLGILWGCAWLSVLACLGAFMPGWTNGGALSAAVLAWILLVGLIGGLRPQWLPTLQTVTKLLGPQDPLVLLNPTVARRDFGPALYDLVWLFGPWLAGVAILNRRELAKRRA
jgi:hypothetical protein